MARLIWRQKDGDSRLMPLGDEVVLGRDESLTCVLNVKSVSRRHARIERRQGDYYILDLESTNGTLVNGSRIKEATPLKSGDLIQVGEEVLEFDSELTSEPLTKGSLATEPLSHAEGSAGAGFTTRATEMAVEHREKGTLPSTAEKSSVTLFSCHASALGCRPAS